jgi:diguanylate cyclase (GGDEF)-like protein
VDFEIYQLKSLYIPQLSLVFAVGLIALFIFKREKKIWPFQKATLYSLIPFYTAIYVGLTPGYKVYQILPSNILSFAAISTLLIHSIYRMYWGRVYIDELTEIKNRRAFDEALAPLHGEYSIAVMDIDHFKSFNDTYGHKEGDNVLRMVADTLGTVLGGNIYRYGGEEFCAIFDNKDSEEAYILANKARRKLESREFVIRKPLKSGREKQKRGKVSKGTRVQVTISVGICHQQRN